MQSKHAVSALLLAIAAYLALANGLPTLLSPEAIALGAAAGLFAAFIDAYRVKVLIEEGAKSTVEYMAVQKPMVTGAAAGAQMVEQMVLGFQKQVTKAIGKSLLAFENIVELAVKGCAAVAAVALLLSNDPFFALGLWIILAALAVAALMKLSGVFSFAFGLVSGSVVPLDAFTKKAKELVGVILAAGAASWLLFAMQWWMVTLAFGERAGVIGVFLAYALLMLLAMLPFVWDGLGLIELAAVLLLPALGVGAGAAFIAILSWEITRRAGNLASVWLLQKRHSLAGYR